MRKRVSIKTINKNKTSKTLLNVFVLTFIMFVVLIGNVYALSYTVSYNNNGGSGTMSNSTFTSNPGILSENTFTQSGYKFMGWNKSIDATDTWYRETNSITGTDGEEINLYAQWCKNSEGTVEISNVEQKDTYGNYVFNNNRYITITVDDKTINYGETPSYSYTVTGTLNGESGVTGIATYTITNSNGDIITDISSASSGTYTISVSGLSAADGYVIQNTYTGILTIQCQALPRTGTYTINGSITYGNKNYTIIANNTNDVALAYNGIVGNSAGNTYNNANTYLATNFINNNNILKDAKDHGCLVDQGTNAYATSNSGTSNGMSGSSMYWISSGQAYDSTTVTSYSLGSSTTFYYAYTDLSSLYNTALRTSVSTSTLPAGIRSVGNTSATYTWSNNTYSNSKFKACSCYHYFKPSSSIKTPSSKVMPMTMKSSANGNTYEYKTTKTYKMIIYGGTYHGSTYTMTANSETVYTNTSPKEGTFNANYSTGKAWYFAGCAASTTSGTENQNLVRTFNYGVQAGCAEQNNYSVSGTGSKVIYYRPFIRVIKR